MVFPTDIGQSDDTVLIERVERQAFNNLRLAFVFHVLYLFPYLLVNVGVVTLTLTDSLKHEFPMKRLFLCIVVPMESCEVGFIVFLDTLLNKLLLNLGRYGIVAFPYQHNEVLQEVHLLDVQLFLLDTERVHRDWILLGIADVFASYIVTESFVGITGINHDHIGVLLPKLTDDAIHVETLTATTWAQHKEVGVIGVLGLSLLTADVYGYWYSLAVCIIDFQWSVFTLGQFLFVHQATGCITQGQESVIIGIHAIAITWEGVDEQFQLVVRPLTDLNTDSSEGILQMVGAFLHICSCIDGYNEVEMAINQLLVVSCYHFLHLLDVFYSNQVAWIRQ